MAATVKLQWCSNTVANTILYVQGQDTSNGPNETEAQFVARVTADIASQLDTYPPTHDCIPKFP